MDTFEWAVAILAATICFGPGLAAVTTAWLFPWLRGSIARPRLWGWGELMLGLFFAMQLMDQTIIFTPHSGDVLFYGGLAFGIAGLYLMMLARSPGTNPEVPAKPYSSEVRLPPSP
ncbi:hypothetical protein [Streptomyces sp. OV198]|uniref:hypothetical protein n=1 Tax=Streptomyces sp. OV198 TaxID=1882787 RepID=UPI0011800FF9|nr:hypothetical protein [Streptomyces sp. OV198]